MFLDRFCSSRLACWYYVWKFSEFSAICFYDWFNIDTVSLLFAWILILIIALPETLCVSLEICYLSSVWNNAYERLYYKQLFCFSNWLFINNFELGGLYWPSMIVIIWSIVGLVFVVFFGLLGFRSVRFVIFLYDFFWF